MNDYSCPICKKKMTREDVESLDCSPFCSERCKMVDLGQWLDGSYVLPIDQRDPDAGDDERK